MIKAIIFDFDGLLVDTETPEFEALKQIYEEHGETLQLETYAQNIGTHMGSYNPYSHLGELLQQTINTAHVKNLHRERLHQKLITLQPRDGVISILNEAKELGLKIGLATSSNRAWIDSFFERLNLTPYFDAISTSDDVERVKPDPALYLRTMQLLQVNSNEVIAFEDSLNGSKAAVAAGIHCIAVPNPVTQHFSFDHCSCVISSMADHTLKQLIASISNIH